MQTEGRDYAGEAEHVLAPTLEFLRQHAPFSRMAGPHLEFLAKHLQLGFYPKGKVITEPGRGAARVFYIIKQGRVRGEVDSGRRPTEGHLWELSSGECFPVGALLSRRPIAIKQRAVEDTFCFELDRNDFEKLLEQSAMFHDFCSRRLANLLDETLRGVQANLANQVSSDVSLNTPLGNIARHAPVTCVPDTPLRQALQRMHAERVGSIVVTDEALAPLGIFTLHDLLARAATTGLPFDTPIEKVMTPKPLRLSPYAPAYEAAMMMARHSIGHVCVVQDTRLVGVVSERDLFSLQRVGVVHLARAIMQAPDIATLAELGHDVHRLVDQMLVQGASVAQLTQIVAVLNDHVTRRAITLCVAAHGEPTVPFTWLSFGSEGRQEQTLKTDQDNGIMFYPSARESADAVRKDLLPLARRINDALAACGYPLCQGNIMASNPECCLTLQEWRARFEKWIGQGTPEHLLNAHVYFDLRALTGDHEPVEELRHRALDRARRTPRFLKQMAENALRNQPPLGFVRDFVVEGEGEHAHMIDLKLRGSAPFVDGARILALANGIPETNTLARLRVAAQRDMVRPAEVEAWSDAYTYLLLLRMRHHRAQQRAGKPLDNHVNPEHLNELDRRVLKESFRQARKLQSTVSLEYMR